MLLWNVPLLLPLPGPPPSPLPLPAKQTADLVPKNCNKVSQAVWLRGETFPFPTPSTEEGAPLQHYSPAEVRLSGPSEVLLALGPVGNSNEASRSILPVPGRLLARPPTQAAAASIGRTPCPGARAPPSRKGSSSQPGNLCCLQAPLLSPLPPFWLPLTSPRHINIRRQMHINLFSPVLQLPLLTACSARGPGLRNPSREGLPSHGAWG